MPDLALGSRPTGLAVRLSKMATFAVSVALLWCFSGLPQLAEGGVALACADYETTLTPVDINITKAGVSKPTSVVVDTGEWVYFADNDENKIVRFTGEQVSPQIQVLSTNVVFGTITGMCLSPMDQSLYVIDNINNSLFEIPCTKSSTPTSPNQGPYCETYGNFAAQYNLELENPSRCAADKAGNIYITQMNEVLLVNSSAFSNTHIPISGALEAGPITIDLDSYDIYVGDGAQGKIFRLPCIAKDKANTQCLDLGTTPTIPNPSPLTLERVVGLALNRGEEIGDFALVVADGFTTDIISIKHPKSSDQSSGVLMKTLGQTDKAADIAIDPVHFDIVVAQPRLNSPGAGALSRLVCSREVFAPSPNVPTVPTPAPTHHVQTSIAPVTPTTPPSNQPQQMSGGSVFLLILFLVCFIYFGLGCIFLRVTRSEWTIPNITMWQNFWGLVVAGFYFAFCCGRRGGQRPVPYDGGKIKTSGDEDLGPKYDNYATMHDDL